MDKDVTLYLSILADLGCLISSDSVILDFGCGEGKLVAAYREAGFHNTWGCDIKIHVEKPFLRRFQLEPYRIPFDDETFDFVYSNSVFEHVQNTPTTFAEIRRVMKPDAVGLHFFPPKWAPIEQHLYVPLGSVIQNYPWLLLWALVGVRNEFQRNLTAREVASFNHKWLPANTCYKPQSEIVRIAESHFSRVSFPEIEMIRHSYGHARRIYPLCRILPPLASLYGARHQRVMFTRA